MDVRIETEFRELDPGEEALYIPTENVTVVSEAIAFSLETNFPFHLLEKMLLGMGALIGLIKEELKNSVPISEYSKVCLLWCPLEAISP